jgi:hypothetical protein
MWPMSKPQSGLSGFVSLTNEHRTVNIVHLLPRFDGLSTVDRSMLPRCYVTIAATTLADNWRVAGGIATTSTSIGGHAKRSAHRRASGVTIARRAILVPRRGTVRPVLDSVGLRCAQPTASHVLPRCGTGAGDAWMQERKCIVCRLEPFTEACSTGRGLGRWRRTAGALRWRSLNVEMPPALGRAAIEAVAVEAASEAE